jgi:DNA-binding response OmpR family regulator
MSGIQVLRDLRRHPTLSDLPIIIVTARMEPNDSSFALACGANVFLRKPFSMAQLKATVEQLATGSEQNLAKTVQA